MLRFQTSRKQTSLRLKKDAYMQNCDHDSNESDFQADDKLRSQGSGQRDSTMASSPGASSSTSKSPNE